MKKQYHSPLTNVGQISSEMPMAISEIKIDDGKKIEDIEDILVKEDWHIFDDPFLEE